MEPQPKRFKSCHLYHAAVYKQSPLEVLPPELLHTLLDYLDIKDVGSLSLVSHPLRRSVTKWIDSVKGMKHASRYNPNPVQAIDIENQILVDCSTVNFTDITTEFEFNAWIATCKNFAIFAKRLTMLYGTTKRLEFLKIWTNKFREVTVGGRVAGDDWLQVVEVSGLSTILANFTAGWDESEFKHVINFIDNEYDIRRKVISFLENENCTEEISSEVRLVLRSFYWDHGVMVSNFLTHLLHVYLNINEKDISRLLYLMFGPSCEGHHLYGIKYKDLSTFQKKLIYERSHCPNWQYCQEDTAISYQEAKEMMEDLGQVITVLFNSQKIKKEEIFSIIDNLVGSNNSSGPLWFIDNISTLLLFSSGDLIKAYLLHLKKKKSPITIPAITVSMVVICDRMDNELSPQYKQGVGSILEWAFTNLPAYLLKSIYLDFWQITLSRAGDSDISMGMLQQLGDFISIEVAKTMSNQEKEEDVSDMEDKEKEVINMEDKEKDDPMDEEVVVTMDNVEE